MADQEKKEREQAQTPAGQEKVSTENGWDPYGNGWPDASVNQYGYDQGYSATTGSFPPADTLRRLDGLLFFPLL